MINKPTVTSRLSVREPGICAYTPSQQFHTALFALEKPPKIVPAPKDSIADTGP